MNYTVGKYKGRWAVLCGTTKVWYFASKPGRKAAQAFANRLNADA